MRKIAAISSLVLLFGISGAASATIVTIELPELVGQLEPYPNHPTAAFDFGTSFLSIDEVRIQVSGMFTPRVVRSSITGELLELTPEIGLNMQFGVDTSLHPLESPFDVEETFLLMYGATWDFLLDGTGEVAAYLSWGGYLIGAVEDVVDGEVAANSGWGGAGGDVIITPGSVEISQAYLTIEGVIPEPATILLLALGIFGVRLSTRKW